LCLVFHVVLKNEEFQLAAILESNAVPYSAVEKPNDYSTVNASTFILIFATSLWVVHVSLKTKIRSKPHSSSRGELPTLKNPPYGLYPTAIQSSN
jgi:hypothetical protein